LETGAFALGAAAGGVELSPVFENKSAVQTLSRFDQKPLGRPDAFLNVAQVMENILEGQAQAGRQIGRAGRVASQESHQSLASGEHGNP